MIKIAFLNIFVMHLKGVTRGKMMFVLWQKNPLSASKRKTEFLWFLCVVSKQCPTENAGMGLTMQYLTNFLLLTICLS